MIIEADGRTYTFQDAVDLSAHWCHQLRDAPGPDRRRVATYLPIRAAQYILRQGCGSVGHDFTAINPLLISDTLVEAILRTEATDIVASPETIDRLADIEAKLPASCSVHVLGNDLELRPHSRASFPRATAFSTSLDGPAVIIYTSGTSGPAKPFFLSPERLRRYGDNLIGDNDRTWRLGAGYYGPWHPAHSLGTIGLEAALSRGLVLVIREKFDRKRFWDDVSTHDCQMAVLMVTGQEIWDDRRQDARDNPLEVVGMGPAIDSSRAFETFFSVDVIGLYGMTEFGTVLTAKSPPNGRTAGRPIDEYECKLGAIAHSGSFPPGTGELLIREKAPEHASTGYHEWHPTGDLFVAPEGEFTFVGRLKDTIRHRGRNISAIDLEQIVAQVESVSACVCIGVVTLDDTESYTADEEIRMFVEPRPGATIDPGVLLDELRQLVPRFMIPRYVDIVDELPRTPTGKFAREGLRGRPLGPSTYDRKSRVARSSLSG